LSALPEASRSGISTLIASVCRNRRRRLRACLVPVLSSRALLDVVAWVTISSRKRLAWRALRATSVMPFLWSSSSSSVTIGR
jgi:hypothetical protein